METKHEVCQCDICHFDEVERICEAFLADELSRDEFRTCMARLRERRIRRKEKEEN